mmetsp:Transcript_2988/g.9157  ORF Transcript_2988/g.9157 Transcript_2988/m.9157 type:complete len:607 (+) Transcript_2988:178-1998(+)
MARGRTWRWLVVVAAAVVVAVAVEKGEEENVADGTESRVESIGEGSGLDFEPTLSRLSYTLSFVTPPFNIFYAETNFKSSPTGSETAWVTKTGAASRRRANKLLRKVSPQFSAEVVRVADQKFMTITMALNRAGSLGLIYRFKKSPDDNYLRMRHSATFLGSAGYDTRVNGRDGRLAEKSNIGVRAHWAFVVLRESADVEVTTPNPPRSPIVLRSVDSVAAYAPRRTVELFGQRLEMNVAGEWYSTDNKMEGAGITYLKLFGVSRSGDPIDSWHRRSAHPTDMEAVRRIVSEIKDPYDPLQATFSYIRSYNYEMQSIVALDKNGFVMLIYNIVRMRGHNPAVEVGVGLPRNPDTDHVYRTRAPLGSDPASSSNVGVPGRFVFTLSADGVLMGQKTRNPNFYGVCSGRSELITARRYVEMADGYRIGRVPATVAFGLRLFEDIGSFARRSEVGFQLVAEDKGFFTVDEDVMPNAMCTLSAGSKRKLQILDRDVRKAGPRVRTFRGVHATIMRFVINSSRESYQGQVVFVRDRRGRLGGILSLPPVPKFSMVFLYAPNQPGLDARKVTFDSNSSNIGRPGKHVFVVGKTGSLQVVPSSGDKVVPVHKL